MVTIYKTKVMKHFLLILFISLTIVSCKEDPNKVPPVEVKLVPIYNKGDVVYLKPDSLEGVVTEPYQWESTMEYRVGFRIKNGELHYRNFEEYEIYGKK
jgi:ribosomal protein L16 Arg81 hydroxylase